MVNVDPKSNSHLANIKRLFAGDDSQGGLRSYLIRGTAGVFILQIFATGLGFVTNVLLARFLGATEYGVYTYVFAWLGLLTVLSMFGFGFLLVREIASYLTRSDMGLVNGLLRWAGARSFLLSLLVAIIVVIFSWLFREYLNSEMFPAFWLAMIILPFLTIMTLSDQAMQGFKRVVLGRVPQVLIRTPLFIILLIIAYLLNPQALNAVRAVGLSFIAIAAAFVVGLWLLYGILPQPVLSAVPEYQQRMWIHSALPLLLAAGMFELNTRTPTIMLGILVGPKETGIFTVAVLITALIGFIFIAANAALGPIISSLYTSGEMLRLQKIVTRSARVTFVIAFVMVLVIIALRGWILLLFGQEFQQSGTAIIILSIGQLFNVASGSVGILLVMTGYEKNTLIAIAISSVVTIVLSTLLIPRWGIEGAALATTVSMMIWNIILIYQVNRLLGINSTALGIFGRWK